MHNGGNLKLGPFHCCVLSTLSDTRVLNSILDVFVGNPGFHSAEIKGLLIKPSQPFPLVLQAPFDFCWGFIIPTKDCLVTEQFLLLQIPMWNSLFSFAESSKPALQTSLLTRQVQSFIGRPAHFQPSSKPAHHIFTSLLDVVMMMILIIISSAAVSAVTAGKQLIQNRLSPHPTDQRGTTPIRSS